MSKAEFWMKKDDVSMARSPRLAVIKVKVQCDCGCECDDLKDARRDIETLRLALQRFVDLEDACEYTVEILRPDLCPGIAEAGGMCRWCQARAALDSTE